MCIEELVVLAASIAATVSKDMKTEDVQLFGDIFTLMGASFIAIADARANCENNSANTKNVI